MKTYSGSCHCGKVRYEVTAEIDKLMQCNCSMCSKRGHLLTFVGADQFRLLAGSDALQDYQFNRKMIHHLFCSTCGVSSFARGQKPDGSEMVAINARCLEGVDVAAYPIQHVDGKNF
ncbi:GFA family protein [Pendulispora brunnea]|uniref:GFA family protein n=1 Tax=Pendulispora brunnea TaxID=2905690 RepID=A0ABZ2KJP4_9BACT